MTGGKPIVSIPPFMIIAFELTILFGALSGVAGFLVLRPVSAARPVSGYSARFSNDRFGVVIGCAPRDQARSGSKVLQDAGAEDNV